MNRAVFRKISLFAYELLLLSSLLVSCSEIVPPHTSTISPVTQTASPLVQATRTTIMTEAANPTTAVLQTAIPIQTQVPTQRPAPTLTAPIPSSSLSFHTIVPMPLCGTKNSDREVSTAAWIDNQHITYGYHPPLVEELNQEQNAKLQWNSINLTSGVEKPADPLFDYDPLFWSRNKIKLYTKTPEIYGFFSPSGRYVIYPIWYGSVFDPGSKTEFWIADLKTRKKFMVGSFGTSNVYITRAAWYSYENRVLFSTTYEGPASFEIADLQARTAFALEKRTGKAVLTESTWRLSPDGSHLAVASAQVFQLVSLQNGDITVVEPAGGYFPKWSADGQMVYYWRASSPDNVEDFEALIAYNQRTGHKRTLITNDEIVRTLEQRNLADRCFSSLQDALWSYEVSPDEKGFLFYDQGMYLIEKTDGKPSRFLGEDAYLDFYNQYPVAFTLEGVLEITEAGKDLHVRKNASLSGEIITNLRPGQQVMFIDGPLQAEGYRWWKVRLKSSSIEGWAVENRAWYQEVPDP